MEPTPIPCPTCDSLAPTIEIHSPKMLQDVAASLVPYLRDGRLEEIPWDEKFLIPEQRALADVAEGKWDDLVALNFCCTRCLSHYELAVETYHGSGGRWRRVDASGK